jgi:tetratricopeptide (TPR) repeat protein
MDPIRDRLPAALAALLLAFSVGGGAYAQQGACEVRGSVKDASKKGIPGVKITLTNAKLSQLAYSGETDKRGDFWFSSLAYQESAREWRLTAEKEGYVPMSARVEVRTSDRTLAQDFEVKLGRDKPGVEFSVRAFGSVRVELTLVPAEEAPAVVAAPPAVGAARASETVPSDPFLAGVEKVREGDLDAALPLLEEGVKAAPDSAERLELLAQVLARRDRAEEAERYARRAVEVGPDRASAHLVLGDALAAQKQYAAAAEAFGKARTLDPGNLAILERIAWIAEETGKLDEAIEANEAIVARAPDKAGVWMALGDLYHRKRQPDKAEQAYRKVVELDPKNAYKTFFNIGVLIESRPKLTEADTRRAIDAYRKAIEIKPDYAAAHRQLGYALLRAGDLDGAREAFSAYLQLAPDAPDAADIRAVRDSLGPAPKAPKK